MFVLFLLTAVTLLLFWNGYRLQRDDNPWGMVLIGLGSLVGLLLLGGFYGFLGG